MNSSLVLLAARGEAPKFGVRKSASAEMQLKASEILVKIEGPVACAECCFLVFNLRFELLKNLIELLRDSDKVERVSAS